MTQIIKEGTVFPIANFPWKKDYPATPETRVTVSYDDGGFRLHFVSFETHLRAVETAPNTLVCQDSCMEMFMQFAPDSDPRYINIEMNPNGAIYSAVNFDRHRSTCIDPTDIAMLDVKTRIYEDRWEIDCYVPVDYIQKHIPTYVHQSGAHLRGNFYKCGDLTDHPHFGCFSDIEWERPDFHRPEFFSDMVLV